MLERLSKFLSHAGIASRRKSEEIVRSGRIKVNDIVIFEPYYQVNSIDDIVTVDNKTVNIVTEKLYVALYKPIGYMSDLKDDRGRRLARDLMDVKDKIFPVGRLDYNSEGLIIFTNDGEFANKVMHPRYGVEKEYLVKLRGALDETDQMTVKKGVVIENEEYRFKAIRFLKSSVKNNWYKVIVDEGKNRMIRKVGANIGHPVLKLKRIRIGNIRIGDLKPGEYRFLSKKEIVLYFNSTLKT